MKLQENFNHLQSPASSKRPLFFSFMKLIQALKWKARKDDLVFSEEKGAEEICRHYDRVHEDLLTLGASLKSAVAKEQREKEDLEEDEDTVKLLK